MSIQDNVYQGRCQTIEGKTALNLAIERSIQQIFCPKYSGTGFVSSRDRIGFCGDDYVDFILPLTFVVGTIAPGQLFSIAGIKKVHYHKKPFLRTLPERL